MTHHGAPDFQALEAESPFPRVAWQVDVAFDYLESTLEDLIGRQLDLNPDFQRAHVWTEAQQAAFVEYILSGGPSARDLYFACEGWSGLGRENPCVIVDGKQRLEAVRRFLRNELSDWRRCAGSSATSSACAGRSARSGPGACGWRLGRGSA